MSYHMTVENIEFSVVLRDKQKKSHRYGNCMDGCFKFGGPGGIRTLDLCVANAALSQLSYEPDCSLYDTEFLF